MSFKPLWVDLEMTGLDEKIHVILEIAAVITDIDFKPLDEYHRIIFQPPEELARMDEWCVKTHGESGLTKAVATGIPLAKAEQELIALLDKIYPDKKERVVLAGNSIGNDRRFIDKYLPTFAKRLHYRMIDVSSFKEIFREKYGVTVEKGDKHRAVQDIMASIGELKTYLNYVKVPRT